MMFYGLSVGEAGMEKAPAVGAHEYVEQQVLSLHGLNWVVTQTY
jgi:hypothetical protein